MNIFDQIINEYSNEYYLLYSSYFSEKEWGNKEIALNYLKKYYICNDDCILECNHIKSKIFNNHYEKNPKLIFKKDYTLISSLGGVLFEKNDFEVIQSISKQIGDKYLFIIQNDFNKSLKKPVLRMKYPVDITWQEIMSGNFISTVLFEMFANEYFVFSDSAIWGKYSANDCVNPIDIIGVKSNYKKIIFEISYKIEQLNSQNELIL